MMIHGTGLAANRSRDEKSHMLEVARAPGCHREPAIFCARTPRLAVITGSPEAENKNSCAEIFALARLGIVV